MPRAKKNAVETRALDIGETRLVALEYLEVSPHNVRKVDINDLGALRASIIEQGLLQPLVGYLDPDPQGGERKTLIAAGQRRLLALQGLLRDGVLEAGATMVPVRTVDETTAIEVSLAENLERKQMNPADEVRAFKALVDTGSHDATTIAKRFGFDVKLVRRRLKMAVLHDEILAALQEGAITVNSAEAYAATDDHAVQMRIFKAQAKSNWKPHDPATILREILNEGFLANGSIGKFIGGRKAYEKAGGVIATDDSFMPLFESVASTSALEEVRLTDLEVIDKLANARMATLHKKVLAMATEQYPFITGIEWVDMLNVGQYGERQVRLPKKSDCKVVKGDWNESTADIVKRAKKAAEKFGAVCCAIISIDKDGNPIVVEGQFVVGKDGWEKAAPKKKADDRPSVPQTPEERAEAERQRRITNMAINLYGRALLGVETPGFGITGVHVEGWNKGQRRINVVLTMLADQDKIEDMLDTSRYSPTLKAELIEPFMAEAEAKLAAILEAEQAEREAAANKEREDQEAAEALLDELEATALVDWPARVTIEGEFGEVDIIRVARDDGPVLEVTDHTNGEVWESDNILETLATIRDALAEAGPYTVSREEEPDPVTEANGEATAAPADAETIVTDEPDPAVLAYVEEGLGER